MRVTPSLIRWEAAQGEHTLDPEVLLFPGKFLIIIQRGYRIFEE